MSNVRNKEALRDPNNFSNLRQSVYSVNDEVQLHTAEAATTASSKRRTESQPSMLKHQWENHSMRTGTPMKLSVGQKQLFLFSQVRKRRNKKQVVDSEERSL